MLTFVKSWERLYSGRMNEALDPLAIARRPTQKRAQERFDRILEEAERVLIERGLSGFSIPVIAERLGFTRGSVYAYFPTPYAVLNELVQRHLRELEKVFFSDAEELRKLGWRDGIARVVDHAVAYHNAHPAARLLLLGGAVTDDSYRAQELTNKRLGKLGRMAWPTARLAPDAPPDIGTLSADIGTACFRRSFFEHGEITTEYRDAAIAAMTGFLEHYARERGDTAPAQPSTATRRRS